MAQQERQLDVKKKRQPEDVKKNRRSAFWSLYSTNQPEPPATNPANFLRRHFWPWLKHYLATLFLPRQRFATYAAPPSERPGVITIPVTAASRSPGTGAPEPRALTALPSRSGKPSRK